MMRAVGVLMIVASAAGVAFAALFNAPPPDIDTLIAMHRNPPAPLSENAQFLADNWRLLLFIAAATFFAAGIALIAAAQRAKAASPNTP